MGELTTMTPESLGRLAAHHDLLAADPANMPMEREYFRERAAFYRSRQYEMLASDVAAAPKRPYPLCEVLPRNAWADFWHDVAKGLALVFVGALILVAMPLVWLREWLIDFAGDHADSADGPANRGGETPLRTTVDPACRTQKTAAPKEPKI